MRSLGRVTKAATSAALSIVLALGCLVSGVALADDSVGTGTGTIQIEAISGNEGVVYNVYKIFTCDVDSDGQIAKNIQWPNDAMATRIRSAIYTYDSTTPTDDWTAGQCASYISKCFIERGPDARIGANMFAMNLAKAVDDLGITTTLTAGETSSLFEGYYMIVSQQASLTGSKVGTDPIFTLLGEGQELSIREKTSLPTLTKVVVEDSDSKTYTYADAQVGQEVTFSLIGTVSDSIASFTQYAYTFMDQLPAGMDLKLNDDNKPDVTVKVTTDGVDYTPAYKAEYYVKVVYQNNTLNVSFTDLKTRVYRNDSGTFETIPVNDRTVVTVTYTASLNSSAALGAAGNANTATLKYSNNPQNPKDDDAISTTVEQTAAVNTYGLKLIKVDKEDELDSDDSTNTKLAGAQFTIQAKTTDEGTNNGKYLKTDGTFGDMTTQPTTTDTEYIFTTDENGETSVKGLDAGTYVIHEVVAPEEYAIAPDLELTMSVDKDTTTGQPTDVAVSLTGGEADGVDINSDGAVDKGTRAEYNSESGIVTVTMTDTDSTDSRLPATGLPGVTLINVAGGTILAVSLITLVRRRMKTEV